MAIGPGARLGPCEILAAIGSGGMGEVYRAKDTRLKREIAIKVLPTHVTSHPSKRQRFERRRPCGLGDLSDAALECVPEPMHGPHETRLVGVVAGRDAPRA